MRTRVDKATAIVNGVTSPEEHTAEVLEIAVRMCMEAGNTELYNTLLPIYERKRKEHLEYHRRIVREYSKSKKRRTQKRRDPDYTDRQKNIINGVIAFEDVHGREFHGIRNAAV